MRSLALAAVVVGAFVVSDALAKEPPATMATPLPNVETYRRLAGETEAVLRKDVLGKWFPAAVDENGSGFFEKFGEDWGHQKPDVARHVVYQARLMWTAAEAGRYEPEHALRFKETVRHGFDELMVDQWDVRRGGFFWAINTGPGGPAEQKHVYGNAFAVYALAAADGTKNDGRALTLAREAFWWLEAHAHDKEHGGYVEALDVNGKPLTRAVAETDAIGTRTGLKSMNTHIHVLEALAELYRVWPEKVVRERLDEVFGIVREKMYAEPGCLTMFFEPDWARVAGRDSFGHDVETAFLLTEAGEVLGKPDDARTWAVARRLVDHALQVGWDGENGGFYDEGTVDGGELKTDKVWWVQAEGLNALLLMHEKFGKETPKYWEAFVKQWGFIRAHLIDAVHGGWWPAVSGDGTRVIKREKSDEWTECYHQGRALMRVTRALQRLAGETAAQR